MFISPSETLAILEHYRYFLIFPIAIVEGPIIIIISGFLVSLKYLNGPTAFVVLTVADVIGDCLYYTIGKFWRKWIWIKKYASFVGYDEKSEEFLEEHFRNHKAKTFLLAKVSHGIGGAVQISAGIARVSFPQFLFYSFIGTVPKVIILLFIGYYAGSSYVKIDGLFDHIAFITISLVVFIVLLYVVINKYAKKFFTKQ